MKQRARKSDLEQARASRTVNAKKQVQQRTDVMLKLAQAANDYATWARANGFSGWREIAVTHQLVGYVGSINVKSIRWSYSGGFAIITHLFVDSHGVPLIRKTAGDVEKWRMLDLWRLRRLDTAEYDIDLLERAITALHA